MRELEKILYARSSRRDFLKLTAGVLGVYVTAGITGCLSRVERELNKLGPKELEKLDRVDALFFDGSVTELYAEKDRPVYYNKDGYQVFFDGEKIVYEQPKVKKKFSSKILVRGDDEFRSTVKNMLDVLNEYSPEWYEKTMYAGEAISLGSADATGPNGGISLSKYTIRSGNSSDVRKVLSAIARFPHEGWHVIDDNTYWIGREDIPIFAAGFQTGLEAELRAGIAEDVYKEEVDKKIPSFFKYYWDGRFNSAYESGIWIFNQDKEQVDQEKYKDRLEEIEQKYFDHENKRLKTESLDESWTEFKNIYKLL